MEVATSKRSWEPTVINHSLLKTALLSIVLFFLIFTVYVPGIPMQLSSSSRICAFILFAAALLRTNLNIRIGKSYTDRLFIGLLKLLLVLFIYASFLLVFQRGWTGATILSDYFSFLVFWTMAFYGIKNLVNDTDELMTVLLIVTAIQAIIIISGVFFPAVRNMVDTLFNSTNRWIVNRDAEHMYNIGYAYGIGCITSSGSLSMGLGTVACLYFFNKRKKRILYAVVFALITLASAMLSRTGLVISGVCFLFIVSSNIERKLFIRFAFTALFIGIVLYWLFMYSPFSQTLMSRFTRLDHLLTYGLYTSYLGGYLGTNASIPPLEECFVIGTGITSGITSNGYTVNIDGGYLRTYSALGLVFAVMYYLFVIGILFNTRKVIKGKEERIVFLFMIFLLLFGEAKEPSLLGCTLCLYFSAIWMIENRARNRNEVYNNEV